jgi:AraC family transcriptional regulator, transcriptional activator FtrA
MSRTLRILAYTSAFLALPLLVGGVRLNELRARERPGMPPAGLVIDAPRPELDPSRRTVVVVLGADLTEITDALGPYEMFARAGAFNVVTAAPSRTPTLLTGGLRVVPHYTFEEIDARLDGGVADVVLVPNIPNIASTGNAPVLAWLKRQAAGGALVHSWCTGAMTLAEAGLLDGRTATAHWGDLPRLKKAYPRVRWITGVRWIDHGPVVMSAGLTSGIDASLHVIARLTDDATARRVARELRYPNYHFALDPRVDPHAVRAADAVFPANVAFRLGRLRMGVGLYPGMDELDLSTLYDTYAFTTVADLVGLAADPGVVVTAHGLTLLPTRTAADGIGIGLDRLVVPGADARPQAATLVARLASSGPHLRPEYPHADEPARFGLEPVIEDLARTADNPTARFALRRLEYRSSNIHLQGRGIPWGAVTTPLALGLLGLVAAIAAARIWRRSSVRAVLPRA